MAYITTGIVLCTGPGVPLAECEFEGQEISNGDYVSADEDVFIGFTLPIVLDNGDLASTKTTLDAVKTNLKNLCSTEEGERVMQPNLGVRLKRFLFEPFTPDIITQVQNVVSESINYWMPFLKIIDIEVKMNDSVLGEFKHMMDIKIHFELELDGMTQESIQITVGE